MKPHHITRPALLCLLCAVLIFASATKTPANEYARTVQFLDKLFADNGLTEHYSNFKRYFVMPYSDDKMRAVTPFIKKLSNDPVKAIEIVSAFGKQLEESAGKLDLVTVLDVIGRTLGFQMPKNPPEFVKETDPQKLLQQLYVVVEAAGGDAIMATDRALISNDRFTSFNKMSTTVRRLAENVYLNYSASQKLADSLAKTKTEIWIDVISALRNSGNVDLRSLWTASRTLAFLSRDDVLEHIYKVMRNADWEKPDEHKWAEGSVYYYKKYGAGRVIVGGPGRTTYKKPAALIIELGGNDTYDFAASSQDNVPASLIIDFEGSDKYISDRFEARTAGAILGTSMLIDVKGSDTYEAPLIGIGSGFYGSSILIDKEGSDRYKGGAFCCGAGMYGFGILWDQQGNDKYETGPFSQGFGGPMGFGLLLDTDGDDSYKAEGTTDAPDDTKLAQTYSQGCGLGFHPKTADGGEGEIMAAGGLGMLCDTRGSDSYDGGYCSQGTGFYLGVGALYDAQGNDKYRAGSHSQGSSMFHSIGLLLEREGRDRYSFKGKNSQGVGYDAAFGALIDMEGNDSYLGDEYAQAISAHKGFGMLFDAAGGDSYKADSPCHADLGEQGEHWEDDWPDVALLIDVGEDRNKYSGSQRNDKTSEVLDLLIFISLDKKLADALGGSLEVN